MPSMKVSMSVEDGLALGALVLQDLRLLGQDRLGLRARLEDFRSAVRPIAQRPGTSIAATRPL